MNKNSPEIKELRIAVEAASGRKMRTPADFELLADCVWQKTKTTISPTTLKRMWGYIKGSDTIRYSTLDILSRYLDCKDWEAFLSQLNLSQSDEITAEKIESKSLSVGNRLKVGWQPDRQCVFEYLGDDMFVVVSAERSKLRVGDTFSCSRFLLGHPMYIDNLKQRENAPVSYVAGTKDGLTILQQIESF